MKSVVLPKATAYRVPDFAAWMPDTKELCREQTWNCVPVILTKTAIFLHVSHVPLDRQ
jgi:hypothetical protein